MCGISGIYNYGQHQPVSDALMQAMLMAIHHRGPDEDGMFIDDNLGIGMRRLSIIDLAGGTQPIYNENHRYVLVFNGEIYNHLDLRADLEAKGHRFRTHADTEVIVHLYEEYGADCVKYLRGMFAFALWDTEDKRLMVARDHLGIKPLYYYHQNGTLVFGSEIKALLQHPEIEAQMNMAGLSDYLSYRYVAAPQTMFDNIFMLLPGHFMLCDENGLRIERYWHLTFDESNQQTTDETAYLEELEHLLKESVRLRLMSDVPFGAFLSGGIDSSTIVALMSHYLDNPVNTFSVGFTGRGTDYSELPYARLVAEKYETNHHEVLVTADDYIDILPKLTWHLDQPIGDYAQPAYYMVSRLASQHVKMVLTGEGGDELFAGYGRYVGARYAPIFQPLPSSVKTLGYNLTDKVVQARRPKAALYALCQPDEAARMASWIPLFNFQQKSALLTSDAQQSMQAHDITQVISELLAQTNAKLPLNRMLYVDTHLWLPDYLLSRGDKLTMANSLEGRVPLLDYKLVEFAARLPVGLKLNGTARKYLLKKLSYKWLPAENIDRKKKGFPVPVPLWLRDELRDFVHDTLSSQRIKERGLFNVDYVENILHEHESGSADHASIIYGLLNLELWQQQFLDGIGQPVSTPSPIQVA